jgi:hypothetical protein
VEIKTGGSNVRSAIVHPLANTTVCGREVLIGFISPPRSRFLFLFIFLSSKVKLLITTYAFCIVQRETAKSKTGTFRDYVLAEAPPGFQAGWSDCVYFPHFLFICGHPLFSCWNDILQPFFDADSKSALLGLVVGNLRCNLTESYQFPIVHSSLHKETLATVVNKCLVIFGGAFTVDFYWSFSEPPPSIRTQRRIYLDCQGLKGLNGALLSPIASTSKVPHVENDFFRLSTITWVFYSDCCTVCLHLQVAGPYVIEVVWDLVPSVAHRRTFVLQPQYPLASAIYCHTMSLPLTAATTCSVQSVSACFTSRLTSFCAFLSFKWSSLVGWLKYARDTWLRVSMAAFSTETADVHLS